MIFGVLSVPAVGEASSISTGSWPGNPLLFNVLLYVLFIINSKKAIINKSIINLR
jgi:hypothetical protein